MTQQLLAAAAVLFGFAVSRRASGEDAAPDLEAVATPSAARGFDEPLPLSPEQVASWREQLLRHSLETWTWRTWSFLK